MSSPDDDRLLQRLGEALAAPAVAPSEGELARVRSAVSRLAERVRRAPLAAVTELAADGAPRRRATRSCADPEALVTLHEALESLVGRTRRPG